MKEVRLCGTSRYRNLVRMDVVTFEELLPSTEQEWLSIAEEFLDKWSFKNGIGVMDKRLNIPKETMLPGTKLNFPFCCRSRWHVSSQRVHSEALQPDWPYMWKANIQLSFEMCSQGCWNPFGILANRLRVFMTPMNATPEKVEIITQACCILHNFLRSKVASQSIYMPPGSACRHQECWYSHCSTWSMAWRTTIYRITTASTPGEQSTLLLCQTPSRQIIKYLVSKNWSVP